jgi:hypothetical protein
VRKLVEGRDCSLLFLPPYSPDFSPIEEVFSLRVRSCSGRPKPAPPRRSAWRSRRLRPRTRWDSSATAATCPPLNHHEICCKSFANPVDGASRSECGRKCIDLRYCPGTLQLFGPRLHSLEIQRRHAHRRGVVKNVPIWSVSLYPDARLGGSGDSIQGDAGSLA